MLRMAAASFLCAAAAPTLAQPAPPATEVSDVDAASEAFAHCIGLNAERVDADTTPEVGAAAVLATCAPYRRRLENVVEMMVGSLPLERRGPALERLRTSLAAAEPQIADAIRAQRARADAPQGATPN